MFLRRLQLLNFKNHLSAEFSFSDGINAFAGENGSGKTNVLDAIHYLSTTKSYFNASDLPTVSFGESYFSIIAEIFREDKPDKLICSFRQGDGKSLKKNGKAFSRLSDYIGFMPAVMITPADIFILLEGSAERRKFFDTMISHCDRDYLRTLIKYNRVLEQRNHYLSNAAERGLDPGVIHTLDEQIAPLGKELYLKRREFTGSFQPFFLQAYAALSGNRESASLTYHSGLEKRDMAALLSGSIEKDRVLQRTTEGIHKDDWEFCILGHPVKRIASQGQVKTFLISLKLAQYDYLKEKTGRKPLLLLDDIFEKIDQQRSQSLMDLIAGGHFGQIFITDTHIDRLKSTLDQQPVPVKYFTLQDGSFIAI